MLMANPFLPQASVYDACRDALHANGYSPLPIGPGTKTPMVFKDGEYVKIHGWQNPNRPMTVVPQPGAGVGVRLGLQRCGLYLVAMDWDDDELSNEAMACFPSAVCKAGRRGHTAFFKSRREIPSKDYRFKGACRLQVLSSGRQTVIPPSVHPDTNVPYWWLSDFTLENVRLENLPEIPLRGLP